VAEANKCLFERRFFSLFFSFFDATDIFCTVTEQNNKPFFYMSQIQGEEEIGH
jgi:hypothetical protein